MPERQDILDKVGEVHTEVAQLNTHIMYIRESVDEQKTATKANSDDIRSLQKSRAWLSGAWFVLSGIVLWVGSHLPRGLF